jgi:acyl phosphate:glycerol-3-phosphate acyltransferase
MIWAVFGYLCGSIPFGLLLTRLAGVGDVRNIGSGNIGATNVLRTGHKALALATLLLDGGKGLAAVVLAPENAVVFAGIGAFFGHLFPIWLKGKGGKGVATGLGVLLGLSPTVGITALGIWLLIALETGYSSAAALGAFLLTPITAFIFGETAAVICSLVFLPCLLWTHRANIARLRQGTETKIHLRKKP